MKYYSISAIVSLLLAVSCVDAYRHPLADDLERLDAELAKMEEYVNEKEAKISTIEGLLASDDLSPEQKYGLYGQLYQECVAYQFDKAKAILESQEAIAAELEDRSLMIPSAFVTGLHSAVISASLSGEKHPLTVSKIALKSSVSSNVGVPPPK